MELIKDPQIIAAIIAAAGTVIAAVIAFYLRLIQQ